MRTGFGWATLAIPLLSATLALGCASVKGSLLTPPEQYAAYRETRITKNIDARLAASARYLANYPDGAFADEVATFFERAEPLYFDARKGSRAGLLAYLEALPQGPHAEEARERLRILERRGQR